jgi:hypothetical protein
MTGGYCAGPQLYTQLLPELFEDGQAQPVRLEQQPLTPSGAVRFIG